MDDASVQMESIMKALLAAFALVALLASPTFAQTAPTAQGAANCSGYGWGPSSPCYGSGN
jgi:hypothetical protein